ncbi:acetylornithine deacetylase/succinyl-diaminopimelate desuccinylase-like protein [Bradyrhizobium sp. USDA 4353]
MTDANGLPSPSAGLDAVFAHIDGHRQEFLARVMDYVRHPSISAHNIGIAEVAALLVRMLREIGLEADTVAAASHPMVLGRWHKKPDAPTVLLYGHYDVQPPDPLDLDAAKASLGLSRRAG